MQHRPVWWENFLTVEVFLFPKTLGCQIDKSTLTVAFLTVVFWPAHPPESWNASPGSTLQCPILDPLNHLSYVWWHMPIISALGEGEAERSVRGWSGLPESLSQAKPKTHNVRIIFGASMQTLD